MMYKENLYFWKYINFKTYYNHCKNEQLFLNLKKDY